MTNRIWAIGVGIVIIAIIGLGWFLGAAPLLAQASAADAQRVTVEQSNQAQVALLAQMKGDFDRLDELEEQIRELQLSIPGELDSDFLYSYLAGIQVGTGAEVLSIATDDIQTYGMPSDAAAGAAAATTDPAAADGSTPVATVPGVDGLYTVPITITFRPGVSLGSITAFAGALQTGPRVFLVTSITRDPAPEASGVITAYMFVLAHPDDTPGAAVDAYAGVLADYKPQAFVPWKKVSGATPTPSDSATPEPTDSATPAPTATGTPAP
jgi:hypothetical protein